MLSLLPILPDGSVLRLTFLYANIPLLKDEPIRLEITEDRQPKTDGKIETAVGNKLITVGNREKARHIHGSYNQIFTLTSNL